MIQLFDALDKMTDYDEAFLLKNKSIKKQQLSNLKASLYKQILASLRIIRDDHNIDLQLHEQMDSCPYPVQQRPLSPDPEECWKS